jgi:RNA polymerase-binding transcription factor DksA
MEDAAAIPHEQPALTRVEALDAAQVAAELDGVELALARLDAGTYWACEVSGESLPDELLAADPTARRLPTSPRLPTA